MRHSNVRCLAFLGALVLGPLAAAQLPQRAHVPKQEAFAYETDHGAILATDATGVYAFDNWQKYFQSPFFLLNGMRCGAPVDPLGGSGIQFGTTGDCSNALTNPAAEYDPGGGVTYTIPVVFHVLQHPNGSGAVSDAQIQSQIDVLNEDFNAIAGTPGASGTNAKITFTLAGITRSTKSSWYNDSGSYWNALAWDTTKYLNIYSNTAGGNLGYAYVPSGGGVVGNTWDRVVLYWAAVGKNAPIGPPYDMGRTGTHEVGHYLGLYHTFQGGCASASGCYSNGDLICDTNPEGSPNYSPCVRSTCGSPDPTDNYMDYSDDVCMTRFTPEQVNRMRCTLANFRVDLGGGGSGGNPPGKAGSPDPADGATGQSLATVLSWGQVADADAYDVYFGTDATPDAGEFQGQQTATTFDPGALSAATTYYWRIDTVNASGTTTGDVWSFTTESGGGAGIALAVDGYKQKGRWQADLTWSGASGSQVEIWRGVNGSALTLLATTANDGAYHDATGFKGGGSLSYQVRESGGGAQSNVVTVQF